MIDVLGFTAYAKSRYRHVDTRFLSETQDAEIDFRLPLRLSHVSRSIHRYIVSEEVIS